MSSPAMQSSAMWNLGLLIAISALAAAKNVYLDRPAPNVSSLIVRCGFEVQVHRLLTADGYQLTVRRLINPKLAGSDADRRPILFIPGVGSTAGLYLVRALDTQARDLSRIDLSALSEAEAVALLDDEPASSSYAYLAAQLGYQVWLLEPRGMPDSLGHISPEMEAYKNVSMVLGEGVHTDHCASGDPGEDDYDPVEDILQMIDYYERKAVNPDYWRFSLDEQANDTLAVVDFVLSQSGANKLALVGHSLGATTSLMAAAADPTLASKVFATVLLAPIVYQMPGKRKPTKLDLLCPKLSDRSLAYHEKLCSPQLACLMKKVCLHPYEGGRSVCRLGRKANGRIGDVPEQHFDYGDSSTNLAKYGQTRPPVYDLTRSGLKKVTILTGSEDASVDREEIVRLMEDFGDNPSKHYYVDQADVFFGHDSPLMHWNVSSLAVVPILREIQLADAEDLNENSPSLFQWIGHKIIGWISSLIATITG